jgi:RNA polymerase sigma-70 factor (ECF subfamily)
LCLIEGRPYGEAAAQVGLSLGAVTQRVSRTRSRLKKKAVMNDEL